MSALPHLHGIVPPLATPLLPDESIDVDGLVRLIESQLDAGVHALWVLGTTAKFEMLSDSAQRVVAETVARVTAGRVPLVLNVSDLSTRRTLDKAARFDDLPYDYYAALPPWYTRMRPFEVEGYFTTLADKLARPLIIYNAPWVNNQITLDHLRKLGNHPRIAGTKDVHDNLCYTQDYSIDERRGQDFTYLHGCDLIGNSVALGADGFVPAIGNAFPELCVALWNAARTPDGERIHRLQTQMTRLGRVLTMGPMLACLEACCRHRGLFHKMLPAPLQSLDSQAASKVIEAVEAVGYLPEAPAVTA
jgi:4-hydroxy-tetrahydrodipicolinate synthase